MMLSASALARQIDHTLLSPIAHQKDVIKLCEEAKTWNFFSVCVHPYYIHLCKDMLSDSETKICTVVGFPLGQNTLAAKAFETENAISLGANEIDMVINLAALKEGLFNIAEREIAQVVKSADGATVKVIIETCQLTESEISSATQICEQGGADFVKTSTGFSSGGATLEAVRTILESRSTDIKVKASGGIRDLETATKFIELGVHRLGTSKSVEIVKAIK